MKRGVCRSKMEMLLDHMLIFSLYNILLHRCSTLVKIPSFLMFDFSYSYFYYEFKPNNIIPLLHLNEILYHNFQESHALGVVKFSQTTYNILETKGKKTTRKNPILAFPSCLVTPLLVLQHLLNNNQMQ